DKYLWGRGLNAVARSADKISGAVAERLVARQQSRQVPVDEAMKRVDEAGRAAKQSFEDGGFYKYGPKMQTGERVNFSGCVDELLRGEKPSEPTGAPEPVVDPRPLFGPKAPAVKRAAGVDVDGLVGDGKPAEARPTAPAPGGPGTTSEFDAANVV